MNKNIKKIIYIVVSFAAFIVCTMGILLSFVFGDNLQTALNSVLKLRIYEPYIGGKTAASVFDPLHDDTGIGSLTYPSNSFYSEGNLDLVLYTVHEPVYNAPWQDTKEYWQLDLEFRTGFKDEKNPDYNKTITIYIDADNNVSGSYTTLSEQGENISFSAEHPWDFALSIEGSKGSIYNSNKEKIDSVEAVYSIDGKKLMLRIPLTKRELHSLYTAETMHHYVFISAYSELDYGKILPIEKRKSRTSGGGLVSKTAPKIYDMLYDGDQTVMLSSWNDDSLEYASVSPVKIVMKSKGSGTVSVSQKKIEELQSELAQAEEQLRTIRNERIAQLKDVQQASEEEKAELALLSLNTGDRKTAEELFKALLSQHPDNPTYTAYTGSLESMKGAGASVIEAVEAVNKGYEYLDKAVLLTDGTLEKVKNGTASDDDILQRFNALLNRGGNSQSVPNSVFLKAAQGALDYLEAAEIARITGSTLLSAQCCYDAAVCFSLDDKQNDASVWKREAARLVKSFTLTDDCSLEDKVQYVSLRKKLIQEGLLE